MTTAKICQVLENHRNLGLAVLVGSRSEGRTRPEINWDIAIQWKHPLTTLENLTNTKTLLRHELAVSLKTEDSKIDLIDLPREP